MSRTNLSSPLMEYEPTTFNDFGAALNRAELGEIMYLTVVPTENLILDDARVGVW